MNENLKTLGLESDASLEDARKAYRKLARTMHPDIVGHSDEAEDEFKKVVSAHDEIMAEYDAGLEVDNKIKEHMADLRQEKSTTGRVWRAKLKARMKYYTHLHPEKGLATVGGVSVASWLTASAWDWAIFTYFEPF